MALTLHGTVADNTAVLSRPNAKPLVINGDMAVAQRVTTTGITGSTSGYFSVDRMKVDLNDNGTWTQTQDTDVPTGQGFAKSWKLDCTTADTSVASATYNVARYLFEGQDLQLLKKGTSNAEEVTVSFWIKATVTGTYIAELFDADNSRQISQAYTVSSSNTWEKRVLSFAKDTSGVLGNDTGNSLSINLWLGAGSNFSSGTLSTTWTGSTQVNRVVGQVNSASSTSNNVYFTGLQMEVGGFDANSLAPFQHESFGNSLARCQRYFQRIWEKNSCYFAMGFMYSSSIGIGISDLPVTMRTSPTLSVATVSNGYTFYRAGAADAVNSFALNSAAPTRASITNTSEMSGTAGQAGGWYATGANGFVNLVAEL